MTTHLVKNNYFIALILILLGSSINIFVTIPLYANLTLHLGAIFSILALYMLGARWAIFVSLAVNLPLGIIMENWFIPVLLLSEISFVAFFIKKRMSLIYADMFYWFVFGMPVTFVVYQILNPAALDFAISAVLKQMINGLLYFSLASIILPFIPSSLKQLVQTSKLQKMRLIIRTRLVTAIVAPSILAGIISAEISVRKQEESLDQTLLWKVQQAEIYTNSYLDSYKERVKHLAELFSKKEMQENIFYDSVELTQGQHDGFISMLVTNENGDVVFASPASFNQMLSRSDSPMSVADRDYFIQAMDTKKLFTSQVFIGRGFGNDVIVAISMPLFTTNETKPTGILEGSLNLSALTELEDKVLLDEESSIVLLDSNRRVIYASENTGLQVFDPFELEKTVETYKTAIPLGVLKNGDQKRDLFYREKPLENGWHLVILQRPSTLIKAFENSYIFIVVIALVFAFLANYIARYIASFIAKPIENITSYYTSRKSNSKEFSIPYVENSFESYQLKKSLEEYRELQDLFQQNLEEKVKAQTKELSEANEEMLKAKLAAQESDRLKSEFLANMSHEIRTPMNGIIGMLLLLKSSELDAQQLHRLNLAKSSADSLLVVINDILDLSKIEAGKMELESIDFNLLELLSEVAESLAFVAQDKGLELSLDVKEVQYENVQGDPVRLKQVLNNLIGNAIKFTQQGSVSITAKIESDGQHGLILRGEIRDTGIGISADKMETLFDAFSQVDSSTTREFGGTGLGLSISKQICELMSGSLNVSSEVGIGSRFRFSVSLGIPEVDCLRVIPENLSGSNVLLLDNGEEKSSILASLLKDWGANIIYCSDRQLEPLPFCVDRLKDIELLNIIAYDSEREKTAQSVLERFRNERCSVISMVPLSRTNTVDKAWNELRPFFQVTKPLIPNQVNSVFCQALKEFQNEQPGRNPLEVVKPEQMSHVESPATNSNNMVESSEDATWQSGTKVLIVEDNLVNQAVLEGLLEDFNIECDIADNGQIALDMLNKADQSYQAIFMDCQMPVMDGYQTTEAIRAGVAGELHSKAKIIAMTANAMEGDREKCLASGMDDYLTKPVEYNQIYQTLLKWLGQNNSKSAES